MAPKKTFLSRIASRLTKPSAKGQSMPFQESILTVAAGSYGFYPDGAEKTMPTGFDPHAAALFEAIVEAGYLVCRADGVFDDTEREAFRSVVVEACRGIVSAEAMDALLADLEDQLLEDGEARRIEMVALTVENAEHREEVLRIASLLAHISDGVTESEQRVLNKLAELMNISSERRDEIMKEAAEALTEE